MDSSTLDLLLKNTYTKTDALRRIRVLNQFLEQKLFNSSQDITKQLNPADLSWLENLGTEFFQNFSKDSLAAQIHSLRESVNQTNPLTIYVPFELPEQNRQIIGQTLRSTYGKNFLFEVKLNPLLIGGCALVWNGIYRDYSLQKRIDQQKQPILSILKEYIK